MSLSFAIAIVMRWMHISAAIVAIGGSAFLRLVLIPVAERTLPEEAHAELRTGVIRRWQKFVHTCILLFLVSGLYNYFFITSHDHVQQPLYHALFGVKFLLALGVFAIAVALTSLKPWSAAMRAKAKMWLAVLLVLAGAIIMISGVLKNLPKTAQHFRPAATRVISGS